MAATATATPPSATDTSDRLLPASLIAAAFIFVALAVVGYGIPKLLGDLLPGGGFAVTFLRIAVQIGAFAGMIYLGNKLVGANPPKGLRGGIFLVLATCLAAFFLWRFVGLYFAGKNTGIIDSSAGKVITGLVGFGLLFAVYKFLTSPRARDYMHGLEEMGWFHTFSYKRTQGLRLRRYTIIGILLVGISGVWTLMKSGMLETPGQAASKDLSLTIPFLANPVTVLSDVRYSLPLLLAAAILWLAWRAVNMPVFADFLIATEAEMNKVSWTPRKRLMQDTIVVLVTTLLLTAFLLVIDIFWGWLLSLSFIGVLPNKDDLHKLKSNETVTKQAPWEPPATKE